MRHDAKRDTKRALEDEIRKADDVLNTYKAMLQTLDPALAARVREQEYTGLVGLAGDDPNDPDNTPIDLQRLAVGLDG